MDEESLLSDAQEKDLAILPLFSALLSILGSSAIIRLSSTLKTSYERILFGLSVADLSSSTVNALGAFLVPRDSSHRIWAVGNDTTCAALGTLYQITTAGFLYSGMLSLYFLLTIRFRVTETWFAKYVEPGMHVSAAGGPLLTGFIGLGLGVYGEVRLGPGCWTVPDRQHGEMFGWMATAIPMVLTLTGVIGGQIMIYRHCRQVLQRSIMTNRRWTTDTAKQARLRNVTMQSLSYVAAFLLVNVWPIVLRVLDNEGIGDEASLYPLLVLQAIFLPIQGFFNCAIYVRPRYLRQRQRYPDQSTRQALVHVLGASKSSPSSSPGRPFSLDSAERRRISLFGRSRSMDASSEDGLPGDSGHGRRTRPALGMRGRTRSFDSDDIPADQPEAAQPRPLQRSQSFHVERRAEEV